MLALKSKPKKTEQRKQNTNFYFVLQILTAVAIIVSSLTPVFCGDSDLTTYGDNGINVLAYICEYGAQWLWIVALAAFIISLCVSGQKKEIIRGFAICLCFAWILCVIVNANPSGVSNTFKKIQDTFLGNKGDGS